MMSPQTEEPANPKPRTPKSLKEFVTYLSSVWGVLGGITALFPLSQTFFEVIPPPIDGYDKSTAPVAIPIATLVSVFGLYYTFTQRRSRGSENPNKAMLSFGLGLISLILFILLEHFEYRWRASLFPGLDSTDDYTLYLVAVIPFYVGFFALTARAFAILALTDFNHR